jgi:hypothetical protein
MEFCGVVPNPNDIARDTAKKVREETPRSLARSP